MGTFRRDAAEVRRARSLVRSSLTSWGLSHQIPALELAVSELVTNALVHGEGDIDVRLTASDDVVRLDVADHGRNGQPRISQGADGGELGGWGLQVVDELSDAWGTISGPAETRVWMERHTGRSLPGPSS
jgi:anti-sigma regulatory factor (Ser/Thr protein kinase)